jgi:membrane protein DedA with SNARE-associated domain
MVGFVERMMEQLGLLGVALLMLLENVFPPIPSEVIMPLAGFVSRRGEHDPILTVVAGSVGSLLGALAWYLVGRRVGEQRLRAWIDRHGRWLAMSGDDVDRAGEWFRRHGGVAVAVGRLVPGVRTLISVPAGFAGMSLVPFLLWSALGTVAWTAGLFLAGWLLGNAYEKVAGPLNIATWVVLGLIVVAYVWRLVRHRPRGGGPPGGRADEPEAGRPARRKTTREIKRGGGR